MLFEKLASPEYVAPMLCEPAVRLAITNAALPELSSVAVARTLVPSVSVTVPEGSGVPGLPPGSAADTCNGNVTLSPYVGGLGVENKLIKTESLLTN